MKRAGNLVLIAAVLAVLASGCSSSPSAAAGPGLAGVGTLPAPASAWPASGYDARRSSGTAAVGPQTSKVRWTRKLEGNVTPGPVIGVDGSILIASNAGVLHALDPATGKDRWTFNGGSSYGSDLSTSPAVLAGGTILWPGPGDQLFALDKNGKALWQDKLGGQPLSPAVAGANRVYVADLAGHLSAFEITATSHRKVWTLDTGGPDYASATVGPDGTVYTAADNALVAVRDLGDRGAIRWRFQTDSQIEVSNAVAPDGTVLLGTNGDREFGVQPNGRQAWAFDKADYTYSSSVVRPDGIGYFGDNAGHLRAIDSATGKLTFDVQGAASPRTASIWTAPAVDAHGNSYYGTVTGHIYGLDPTGRQLFDLPTGSSLDSYPAIGADGTLYLGTSNGTLYALHS